MNRYLGKLVMVISTSSGPSSCCASSLRYRMFASTMLKWARSPPYGFPGVPSIMYDPYSGLHSDLTLLQGKKKYNAYIHMYSGYEKETIQSVKILQISIELLL